LRTANYTANNLNQYTQRDVPGTVDIIGVANAAATATVNGQSTYRKVEYYQKALAIANSSTNVWQSVSNQAVLAGATNITAGNIFVPKTPESFAYDADGNETNDGRWSFIWDAENRPLTMLSSNVVDGAKKKLDFLYDWRGRRRTKVVSTWNGSAFSPASTNRFVYDDWNLVAEMDATNNLIRSYLWGLDLSGSLQGAGGVGGLIAVNVATNGFHFAAYDGNGNIVALLKATDGTISANYEYGPFGELIRSSGAAASANPCRLSTKYTDDESDFLYYGYRFYNSSSGRWLNRDPIMEYGGLDLEQFAAGDPINTIDALGLRTLVLNFGFDNSAPWNEQSGTRQDINRNLEFLKGVIKKCCDTFKIGCDITVKANYDFGTGMFDEGNKPAPKNGYDFSDLTLYLANLNKITAPEDGVKILITERSITAFQGKTKAGGWTTGGGILLNVNPPQDGGAGAGGVAHELGHYCGYACGDYKLPSGVTDTGHSSDPTNPMYFANSKGNVPDECYCKGIDKKAK